MGKNMIPRNIQFYKFCTYGFLKNLRLFEPFLILFFQEKGLEYYQIGIVYAVREMARNIFEIPSGIMADVFGRRRTMIISFIGYIVSFLIFYFFMNLQAFIVAMIFYGFGDAFRTGTHKAMIFEYLKINRLQHIKTHYYGHTRSWSQKGSAISSLLAAGMVFYFGNYSIIFIVSTIPYLLELILIASYPKELEGGYKQNRKTLTLKESFSKPLLDLKKSFQKKGAIKCILNISIFSGYQKAIKDYIQPMIKTLALSFPLIWGMDNNRQTAIFVGVLYFIIYLFTSFASKQAGFMADKLGKNALNITLFAGFLTGMISGLFYGLTITGLAILFFSGTFIFENLRKPMGISYISERFDDKILASSLSIVSQAETLFAAIFAILIGFLADVAGVKWAILILSGLALLVFPLISIKEKATSHKN